MNPRRIFLLSIVFGIVSVLSADESQETQLVESEGTGRYFPLLPPYHGIDFAANFNKLKSNGDIAYFVIRDSIAWLAINSFWVVAHSVMWDGEATTLQDVITSITTPFVPAKLSTDAKIERLNLNSISELSPVGLWNFFTNPNTSTRNLYLSFGFALGAQILWILPTFFGTISTGDEKKRQDNDIDRTLGIPGKLVQADPAAAWNRIFKPQGILQIVAINTLNYFGKLIFWTVMANLPDLQADSVITGRSNQGPESFFGSLLTEFMDGIKVDVEYMIDSLQQTQPEFKFY